MKCRICHKKRRKSIAPIAIAGAYDLTVCEEEGSNIIMCCSACRAAYRSLNHKFTRKARSNWRRARRYQQSLQQEG